MSIVLSLREVDLKGLSKNLAPPPLYCVELKGSRLSYRIYKGNYRSLAKSYRLSEGYVRRIINKKY